jgi:flagellar basal body-associated protein FliL
MEPENQAPQDQPAPQQTPQKPSKGYGKRPVWQWILIYVVIAIVVYGIIYLLFIHKSGSTGSGY